MTAPIDLDSASLRLTSPCVLFLYCARLMEAGAGGRGRGLEGAAGAGGVEAAMSEEEADMESVGEKERSEWDECEWSNQVESY